jgi:hypothetical protein
LATLFILPSVFALVQRKAVRRSASLDPDDPQSIYYSPPPAAAVGAAKGIS